MIELTGLQKSFRGKKALDDVTLFIPEGEIFGIIGRSGAGKSTLLRCINLLERPEQGKVLIHQEAIQELSGKALIKARHKTAMVFQHFNLLSSQTVYDNIALPMRIQGIDELSIRDKMLELLRLVELEDRAQAYPSELSGGQKQRVAIARALSCSPKILLCDEATSALDPETTDAILALLQRINQRYGITIVLITHEMEVVKRICHRLAVMEDGKLIEVTSMANLFGRKDSTARSMLYAQLSPEIPPSLSHHIGPEPNQQPVVRIFFEGSAATVPFISQCSRELNLDITILLANIDRFDQLTCGVLIAELNTDAKGLEQFLLRCEQAGLSVEVLGYVRDAL